MKIAVTGASGRLGKALAAAAAARGHQVAAWSHEELDIGDADAVSRAVAAVRPDWIVNAAAKTNVDACETDREAALRVNGAGVAALGAAGQAVRARLCHVSTDYVFPDAPERAPWRESDEVGPVNYYGTTKLAGERAAARWSGSIVARVALVYGDAAIPSFVEKVFERACAGQEILAAGDMAGSPSYAPEIAVTIVALCEQGLAGTWHVAGAGGGTRHALAVAAAEAVRPGAGADLVRSVKAALLGLPARRPVDTRLDAGKLAREAGIVLRPWEETVKAWASRWLAR